MRAIAIFAGMLIAVTGAFAADQSDLLNFAVRSAVDSAKTSLEQARSAKPEVKAVKRVGIATFGGDPSNVTALMKSVLTKTDLNVVLTSDADWGPLLDEFARQVKREDLILKETAHKLRVQGVDAVIFGTVEKSSVDVSKQKSSVRVLLNMASTSEANPGSQIWSEQITGTGDGWDTVNLGEKALVLLVRHWITAVFAGGFICLLILIQMYRYAVTPR